MAATDASIILVKPPNVMRWCDDSLRISTPKVNGIHRLSDSAMFVRGGRPFYTVTKCTGFNCAKFCTKHLRSHTIKNLTSFKRSSLRVLTLLHPHYLNLLCLSAGEALTVYTSDWLPARWHPSLPPVILIPPKHVTYRLCTPGNPPQQIRRLCETRTAAEVKWL